MKKGLTLLLSLVLVLGPWSVTAFAAEDWVTPVQNIENWDEEVDFSSSATACGRCGGR